MFRVVFFFREKQLELEGILEKMGQIVKKKNKGRPPKEDPAAERDLRRREKELDLLLNLQESTDRLASCSSSSDGAGKPSKKRKIDQKMDEDANEEENYNDEDEEEVINDYQFIIVSIGSGNIGGKAIGDSIEAELNWSGVESFIY